MLTNATGDLISLTTLFNRQSKYIDGRIIETWSRLIEFSKLLTRIHEQASLRSSECSLRTIIQKYAKKISRHVTYLRLTNTATKMNLTVLKNSLANGWHKRKGKSIW